MSNIDTSQPWTHLLNPRRRRRHRFHLNICSQTRNEKKKKKPRALDSLAGAGSLATDLLNYIHSEPYITRSRDKKQPINVSINDLYYSIRSKDQIPITSRPCNFIIAFKVSRRGMCCIYLAAAYTLYNRIVYRQVL